jgi:squalene-associated FAD-dependent desaturase
MKADAVIIGAGFAGLSAAVRLAGAGLRVMVAEEAPRLGGRGTAFTDRETNERVDNGQHVLFGCYRETYDFLRAIGASNLAPLQRTLELTMIDERGRAFDLRCPPLPPPWHLIAGVLRWRALGLADRISAARMRRVIADARRIGPEALAAGVRPDQTVDGWLRAHGQTERLCEWLWRPLALAALNQSSSTAAAAPFVRVLAELFGPRVEDSAVGLPRVPLDELYAEPARRFIEARGGRVLTRSPARLGSIGSDAGITVMTGGERVEAASVISTVPWFAFDRLRERTEPHQLDAITASAAAMRSSPIVTVNFWFDGPVVPAPFIGLVGGPMHWVFDKSAIVGDRANHLSIVASGADELASLDNTAITGLARAQLARALPRSVDRRLLRSVVVREHRATFSLAPGQPARPKTVTPVPGFYLAGDWTDTGLPGTIEGAVKSGHAAAEAVLSRRS